MAPGAGRFSAQARSARDGQEPGDVCGGSGKRADHRRCSSTTLINHRPGFGFNLQITLWLWFTVLFANFAEAMAEGRGKAQADTLRKAKGETIAKRYTADGRLEEVASGLLRAGDMIYVEAGQLHRRRRRGDRRRRLGRRVGDHR